MTDKLAAAKSKSPARPAPMKRLGLGRHVDGGVAPGDVDE